MIPDRDEYVRALADTIFTALTATENRFGGYEITVENEHEDLENWEKGYRERRLTGEITIKIRRPSGTHD